MNQVKIQILTNPTNSYTLVGTIWEFSQEEAFPSCTI